MPMSPGKNIHFFIKLSIPFASHRILPIEPLLENTHYMLTRGKIGHLKPKVFHSIPIDQTKPSIVSEPLDLKNALIVLEWKKSKEKEYNALVQNKIWELVPLPSTYEDIPYK